MKYRCTNSDCGCVVTPKWSRFIEAGCNYTIAVKEFALELGMICNISYERMCEISRDQYNNEKENLKFLRDTIKEEFKCPEDKALEDILNITSNNNILIYTVQIEKFPILQEIKEILVSTAEDIEIMSKVLEGSGVKIKASGGIKTKEDDDIQHFFTAMMHDKVLFFSSKGIVYKMKVYKLPLGSPTSKGKPFVNLLPLTEGENITAIMKLPEQEEDCKGLSVMFATSQGNIRRNALTDFVNVQSNGKIAMKLDEGDKLINVAMCDDNDDVMLAAKSGKCNRFAVADCRVFVGRNSTGVRGIKLADNDEVISMSILKHIKVPTEEREEYLRLSSALKRTEVPEGEEEEIFKTLEPKISYEQYKEMREREEFILTVTVRSEEHTSELQGVANMEMSDRNKEVISSFPVKDNHQIMMVTDGGKLIRMPVEDIRIAGRKTQGVILFRTAENENVVSVTWLDAEDDDDENDIAEEVNEFDGVTEADSSEE